MRSRSLFDLGKIIIKFIGLKRLKYFDSSGLFEAVLNLFQHSLPDVTITSLGDLSYMSLFLPTLSLFPSSGQNQEIKLFGHMFIDT